MTVHTAAPPRSHAVLNPASTKGVPPTNPLTARGPTGAVNRDNCSCVLWTSTNPQKEPLVTHRLPVLAALVTAGLAAAPSDASADIRIRVGGRAHVHARTGVHIRTPRVHWRPRWHYSRPARVRVGGSIWVGGGYYYNRTYAAPPPAYCECGPSTVPSYYPVAPQPTTYAAAVAVRPELPRFGIGVFAGGVDIEGDHEGSDYGLFARLRLTPGLSVIGEIGKSE